MHTEVEHIAQLTAFLEKDLVSPHPRYPQQALYAVRDERVALAIAERLHNNETLINIVPLDYSFYTGLIPIYFEFAKAGGIGLGPTSLLVILDYKRAVVGMVNPFDPMQPNPDLPTLPQMGAQPFALSRPSAAERTLVSPEQLFPQEARSRAYFQKMALPFAVTPFLEKSDGGSDDGDGGDGGTGGSGGGGDGGGGDGGDGGRGTRAGPYTTGTAPPHNPDFHLDYDYD